MTKGQRERKKRSETGKVKKNIVEDLTKENKFKDQSREITDSIFSNQNFSWA